MIKKIINYVLLTKGRTFIVPAKTRGYDIEVRFLFLRKKICHFKTMKQALAHLGIAHCGKKK